MLLHITLGILMIISAVTHISQLFLKVKRKILPSIAGIIYFLLGIFLILNSKTAIILGIFLPFLGGLGGSYRYLKVERVKLIIFHIFIDILVVAGCVYLILF